MKPEAAFQTSVVDLIDWAVPGAVLFSVPNEGVRTLAEAMRLRKMGLRAGVADLVLVHTGRAYFIECKSRTGKLTPEQQSFARDAKAAGAEYAVVRDLDELRAALQGWGIATREAHHG